MVGLSEHNLKTLESGEFLDLEGEAASIPGVDLMFFYVQDRVQVPFKFNEYPKTKHLKDLQAYAHDAEGEFCVIVLQKPDGRMLYSVAVTPTLAAIIREGKYRQFRVRFLKSVPEGLKPGINVGGLAKVPDEAPLREDMSSLLVKIFWGESDPAMMRMFQPVLNAETEVRVAPQ
jgi:hypothetical protein